MRWRVPRLDLMQALQNMCQHLVRMQSFCLLLHTPHRSSFFCASTCGEADAPVSELTEAACACSCADGDHVLLRRLQQLLAEAMHADQPAAAQPACATNGRRSPTADSRGLCGVRGRGEVTSSRNTASALPLPSNLRSRSSLVCSTCSTRATHGLEASRDRPHVWH